MKRGWTKSSLFISALALLLMPATRLRGQESAQPKRVNELTLAGLRPGHDGLAVALKRYSEKSADSHSAANAKLWLDPCTGRALSVEMDGRAMIRAITVSLLVPQEAKCGNQRFAVQDWITGRGLRLGDPQDRVVQLYGEPNSSGPAVHGERELEFLRYAFDWAGSDVPQILEIDCARENGRVVEITLAFPSL